MIKHVRERIGYYTTSEHCLPINVQLDVNNITDTYKLLVPLIICAHKTLHKFYMELEKKIIKLTPPDLVKEEQKILTRKTAAAMLKKTVKEYQTEIEEPHDRKLKSYLKVKAEIETTGQKLLEALHNNSVAIAHLETGIINGRPSQWKLTRDWYGQAVGSENAKSPFAGKISLFPLK